MCQRLIWIFLLLCTASCDTTSRPHSKVTTITELAMGMPYRVIIGKELNRTELSLAYSIIYDTFNDIDLVYNNWNPDSEISKLNQSTDQVPIKLSEKLAKILLLAEEFTQLSRGYFDPTVAPLSQLWKESLKQGHLPDVSEALKLKEAIGWSSLSCNNGTCIKKNPLTALDLGGIAKGYGVDLLVDNLASGGFTDVYVEWGGEIRAAGNHPDNRNWTIFISSLDDTDPDHAIDIVELDNCAIATSGNYLQKWTVGDATYTHIINPKDKAPLQVKKGLVCSATVQAPTCVLADVLATAAMLFPTKKELEEWAEEVIAANPGVRFWFVY